MSRVRAAIFLNAAVLVLVACGPVDRYEAGVQDYEPTYCYAALGGTVECYREPVHSDDLRLVNYYGPHPSRYDAPDAPDVIDYKAPPMINSYVKDPEPLVRARPSGDTSATGDRPWLASGYQAPIPPSATPQAATSGATRALIRQAHENLAEEVERQAQAELDANAAEAREARFRAQLDAIEFPFEIDPQGN